MTSGDRAKTRVLRRERKDGRDPDGGRAVALVTLSGAGHLAFTWGAGRRDRGGLR
jgi:hypothetical protein